MMADMSTLVVMALPEESQGLIEQAGYDVVYCGVGKVNAAYALMHALGERPDISHIINIGSAGSSTFKTGATVAADRFVQRDMDATGIGFAHGQTPFCPHPITLEFSRFFNGLEHGVCGSGDSFLQGPPPIACDIIDMEAYALARVCYLKKLPFSCLKYITDGADGSAHLDWQENLSKAAQAFVQQLHRSA